ncbi:distal membrane-arm assembly complex protein 2 [Leptopilina heterotoma]|uniref:distal membrane-arm assembly complex protein 2 n=1 Tax=Leptopilina heterotoma TaxID=63436 RepID=UPI001CA90AFA|nr:distal membrane-arm assembly complex protein 2 [Leptopilina heterotoma]
MIIKQLLRTIEKSDLKYKYYNHVISRCYCIDLTEGPAKRQEKKLRQWQKEPDKSPKSIFSLLDRTQSPNAKKDRKPEDGSFFNPIRGEEPDYSFRALRENYAKSIKEVEKEEQKYIPARLNILGSDLGVAHFVIFRGGRVKFRHKEKWYQKIDDKQPEDLPEKFDARFIAAAIDCTDMKLYYEGLLNFENLTRVKWLSFRGNPVFDEWCLDRVVGQIPCVEYLDVSNCPKLNERGLEALYKLFYLKKLIVTNYEDSVAFELTCLMLEDCNPNLECIILKPGEIHKEEYEEES